MSFKIDGDVNETGVRSLNGEINTELQRSSIDSFIMAVKMLVNLQFQKPYR